MRAIAGAEVSSSVLRANPLVPTASVRLPAIAGVETPGSKAGAPAAWLPRRWRIVRVRALVVIVFAFVVVARMALR